MSVLIDLAKERVPEFIDWYEDDDEYGRRKENQLMQLRLEFVNRFNANYVQYQMTKDSYCIGKGDESNFCYIIERTLRGLGSILGATSSKFGLYWSKDDNDYVTTLKFGSSVDSAFSAIKKELLKIIKAAQDDDINRLSDSTSKFGYMVRHKVYYLYNPKHDIPVFNSDHLDRILSLYEIPFSRVGNVEANKRIALYNFKSNDPAFSQMTNKEFMAFLYSDSSCLDLKTKRIIEDNKKDEEFEFVEVNQLEDDSQQEYKPRKGKTNYDDIGAKASYVGEAGEKLVLKYEKMMHPVYKNRIKRVSEDNDHLGYDILSFDDNGNEVYIEVKTKKHGDANNVDFFITSNELKRMEEDNHVIYYVCGITRKKKKIYAIRKDIISQVRPQPILYKVKAKILN